MQKASIIIGLFVLIVLTACGTGDNSKDRNLTHGVNQEQNESDVLNEELNATAFGTESGSLNCVAFGGCFLFEGYDPKYGFEPWITDGVSGSFMMADTNKAEGSSYPSDFFSVGGQIYFEAQTPEYGKELYRVDTTTLNVNLVSDLTPGPDDTNIYSRYAFRGDMYFTNTVANQTYLYRTDAGGTRVVKLDSGNSFSLFASTKEWLYYVKDHNLYRTDGFEVKPIDVSDPRLLEGCEGTLLIWKKEGERYSPDPTDFYALSDDKNKPKLIKRFDYQYSSFQPNVLWKEEGVIYFNSAAVGGLAVETYNYRVYRYDTESENLDIPVAFEYSEGGEYIYKLFAEGNHFYMLTSRQYTSGSGVYSPETGTVYEPDGFYNALYRFDKNLKSKTLLHLFEKNAPTRYDIKLFSSLKDKIYLYNPDYQKKTMYAYDTSANSLSELPAFEFGKYGQSAIVGTESGVLYGVTDANETTHIRRLDYQTDAIENITDLSVHTALAQDNEFQYLNGKLFFRASDESSDGVELYMFDIDSNVRKLVKNINISTMSSDWNGAAYFGDMAVVDTGNSLYASDFTTDGSRSLGEFGPYRYTRPDKSTYRYVHAPSEMIERNGKYYVSAPDVNGTTSLFVADGSADYGLKKLWDSGTKLDEIHLLNILGDKLYFKLEDRVYSSHVKYYVVNLLNHAVAEVEGSDPLLSVFQNRTIVAQMGDAIFVDENSTLVKFEFRDNGVLERTRIHTVNGNILKAKGNKKGFFFFVKALDGMTENHDYSEGADINSTISIWYSDGSSDGTVQLYSFHGTYIEVAAAELIDSELIYWLNRYRLDCNSDFGFCPKLDGYNTYHIAASDTAPTLMVDEKVSAYGRDGNPNVILMQKSLTEYEPFELKYWRYDLSADTMEKLDISPLENSQRVVKSGTGQK